MSDTTGTRAIDGMVVIEGYRDGQLFATLRLSPQFASALKNGLDYALPAANQQVQEAKGQIGLRKLAEQLYAARWGADRWDYESQSSHDMWLNVAKAAVAAGAKVPQ